MPNYIRLSAVLALSVILPSGTVLAQAYRSSQDLLVTNKTVVGENIRYPVSGTPRVTVSVITIEPGSDTAIHRHPAPLVVYILEGEVVVDYGSQGKKTFKKGDTFVEAMDVAHRGVNQSGKPVKILSVYIGAEGTPNVSIDK